MFDPNIILNHWLIPFTRVQAGEFPGSSDVATARGKLYALLAMGTNTIIDLTEPSEGLRDYEALMRAMPGGRFVTRVRAPIQDVSIADDAQIHFILDVIEAAIADHRRIYVHCWGGVGRTGMIAGCLLVRRGMQPTEALDAVEKGWRSVPKARLPKHLNRSSPETEAQKAVVRRWAASEAERRAMRGETARIAVMTGENDHLDLSDRADLRRRARGCLLGGAIGDALGLPIEFWSLAQIRETYGPLGVTELATDMHLGGAPISDDTQMTLFTAEGMLRGISRSHDRGIGGPRSCMTQAYLRWMETQGEKWDAKLRGRKLVLGWAAEVGPLAEPPSHLSGFSVEYSGWLVQEKALHARRAPGLTCLGALRAGGIEDAREWANDSKGNGGVMRVAPIGLFPNASPDNVFEEARFAAGITHGHPTGQLSAGAFAVMIHAMVRGASVRDATEMAMTFVSEDSQNDETWEAMQGALSAFDDGLPPSAASVESFGEGKVAEEALAIAIFCALHGEQTGDVAAALLLSVNHGGDSDSTGSMTGQLLGVRFGVERLPERWLKRIELREVITQVADDIVTEWREGPEWFARYPSY